MKKLAVSVAMAVALAGGVFMALPSGNNVVIAGQITEPEQEAVVDCTINKDIITVKVNATGDMEMFGYNVAYDSAEVEVQSYELSEEFKKESGCYVIEDVPDQEFIAFGGVVESEYPYTGTIATLTFKVKDGVKKVEGIKLISDMDNPVGESSDVRLLGDADGDGRVDLTDAQMTLKVALKIMGKDKVVASVCDADGDNSITLSDAQWVLRRALKIL